MVVEWVRERSGFCWQIVLTTKEEGGSARPFAHNAQLTMYSLTWDAPIYIQLRDTGKDMVMPGDNVTCSFITPKKMVIEQGEYVHDCRY